MQLDHLESRSSERLEKLFCHEPSGTPLADIFLHQSDIGVIRNGGRNGARFAPKAIFSILKKLAWHGPWNQKVNTHFFSDQEIERESFINAQTIEFEKIYNQLKNSQLCIQIGGGHDHIYPFLKAISKKHKKIICFNIDAHCDTRTDKEPHSGTPFRQFAELQSTEFELHQIGIHSYSNSVSTMSPVPNTKIDFHFYPIEENLNQKIEQLLSSIEDDVAIVFSLDLDALEAGLMEGVSAVNHQGISSREVQKILETVLNSKKGKKYFGFYEYNPLYDNLSQKGARFIASLIYNILENYSQK
jgi:formiminoglutamase